MKKEKFSFNSRIKSFGFAFNGLKILVKEEHNFRIHLVAAILASLLSVLLQVSIYEWFAVLFCIAMVIGAEIVNTCLENICDLISADFQLSIKKIKDMAAALVLISSLISLIVAAIVFVPKLIILI